MENKNQIDPNISKLLINNYAEVLEHVKEKQSIAHEEYNKFIISAD